MNEERRNGTYAYFRFAKQKLTLKSKNKTYYCVMLATFAQNILCSRQVSKVGQEDLHFPLQTL